MKLFECNNCGHPVYFENYYCVQCNAPLGFDPVQLDLISLEPFAGKVYTTPGEKNNGPKYKYCSNKQYNVCNWLVPFESDTEFCVACSLNRTIPNLSQPDHWEKWARIEVAKHRLVYSLLRLGLPVISKLNDEENGLAFDFMEDDNKEDDKRLLTGHDHGLITLNIEEADDAIIEMARNKMDEVYRTLLGHFRHEVGHYYWEQLIERTGKEALFRDVFGDERTDYEEALKQHYDKDATHVWQNNFISAYAASHPWEDWAETWAHYLHIVDTLETGYSFGMTLRPVVNNDEMNASLDIDPYSTKEFDEIIKRWVPLSFVMNSLNRSMGMKDSYPFIINEAVIKKLKFIHEVIRS
ncbi:MAG: putative zinc-binding peptidase [Ferruginibacter sp.]